MILKKMAAALAGVLLLTAQPMCISEKTYAEVASDPKIAGDVNNDGSLTIADMVTLHNYILGKSPLDKAAFNNADMNGDGLVNSLDFSLMRKEILITGRGITKTIEQIVGGNGFYGKTVEDPYAVITSVSELKEYFAPNFVWTVDGECVIIEVAYTETIQHYLDIYNDEFFEDNVLCLGAFYNTTPDVNYSIEKVFYEDKTLKIQYVTDYGPGAVCDVIVESNWLAQVVVPKELYMADSVVWEKIDKSQFTLEFTPTVTYDVINSAEQQAWDAALRENGIRKITNTDKLDSYISGKFRDAVVRSLKEKYDEEFFKDNILILDVYAQHDRDDWETIPSVERSGGKFVLTYNREFIDGFVDEGIMLTQIVIPREQNLGEDVERRKSWEKKEILTYCDIDVVMSAGTDYAELVKADYDYAKKGQWVDTKDEMRAYLSDILTDEGMEKIGGRILNNGYGFGESLDEYSAYIWVDLNMIGASYGVMSSGISDDSITVNMKIDSTFGCEVGDFIHVLYADKEQSGKNVRLRSFVSDHTNFRYDGECIYYSTYTFPSVMVNQYSFGGKTSADIYIVYPVGIVLYGDYVCIGTAELENGFMPFSEEYEVSENEYGQTVYTGENFVIISDGTDYSVSCRTAENSDNWVHFSKTDE